MTHLVCSSRTLVSSIPLHRRLLEVMKEKGAHYSQQAMSKRLGISRETLRNMLNGEREIYQFELQKIAQDLRVSVDRLTQADVADDVVELRQLLQNLSDNQRAVRLATIFLEQAIGDTEKCDAQLFAGRAHFELHQYEAAHEHRLAAYSYAMKLQEKYGETERLHEALKFLMTSYTVRKEYSNAKALVEQVHDLFLDDPTRYAALCYSLAMIAFNSGNLEEARDRFVQSLECYKKTDNVKEIGRAEHCVAFIEYKMGNYIESKMMFVKAITTLSGYLEPQLVAIKDYIKVLFQLSDYSTAENLINESIRRLELMGLPMLEVKFQLLRSIALNDPADALLVLDNESSEIAHKVLACRILLNYYCSQEDAYSVMRYYRIMERLTQHHMDTMGEGDL